MCRYFDWRALQRWQLDEDRLPANSRLEHRIPSAWESYKWYIVGGITLILLQTALVLGLLVSRAERRRAEQAQRESEAHRRRAEEDVQRQRDELAHALRLTTLGELTASISHELNQPLTAIAVNAQAAQQLFRNDRANPDLEEALEDLVTDSIRAAEIIRRLQALFRKRPAVQAEIDVNAVIEDVLHLLGSDLRNRQIRVHFQRFEPLMKVLGDSVQLRQVVINLLRNAEDAIAAAGEGAREIRIETSQPDDERVAHRGPRQRCRREGGRARAHLRPLCQQQTPGAGYGARHQPQHRRGARGSHLGPPQRWAWHHHAHRNSHRSRSRRRCNQCGGRWRVNMNRRSAVLGLATHQYR